MTQTGIEVELIGRDGNAFYILGAVVKAMRRHGIPESTIDAYLTEAKSGDYDNLLRVTGEYVEIV